MKSLSKFRVGAIAALVVVGLVGTAVVPATAGQYKFRKAVAGSGAGITIGFIGLDDAIGFGKDVHDSITREAKKAGAKLVFCDSKLDAAKALNCAKTFKLKKVQGYLNFQPVASASKSICAAGPQVPVIAIDIEQDPCQDAFMGADNSFAGEVSGTALGQYFKDKFNCEFDAFISLEDYGVGVVNAARMGGYRTGFESICGAGSIGDKLIQIDAGRLEPALAKMKDALTTLPGANKVIVVAINDEGVQGAFAAAKGIGRADDIYGAGQGASASAWCDIASTPNWIADTAYFPERYGQIGVPYLLDLIKGKKVPFQLKIKHKAVNAKNIFKIFPKAKAQCA